GDTLSAIARRFGTTWQALAAYNRLPDPDLIHPGQVIRIPGEAPSPEREVTVRPEDTLSAIARRFGTTWQALAAYNRLPDPDLIHPGQVIRIPG
ncbi:MAG: LysM peptidoglycan-binding domain-containing protein, partial [Clostridia bacterium]|nr:LysM peptidoglycan-binding domain-containing protein [Clostridia bacterium]